MQKISKTLVIAKNENGSLTYSKLIEKIIEQYFSTKIINNNEYIFHETISRDDLKSDIHNEISDDLSYISQLGQYYLNDDARFETWVIRLLEKLKYIIKKPKFISDEIKMYERELHTEKLRGLLYSESRNLYYNIEGIDENDFEILIPKILDIFQK